MLTGIFGRKKLRQRKKMLTFMSTGRETSKRNNKLVKQLSDLDNLQGREFEIFLSELFVMSGYKIKWPNSKYSPVDFFAYKKGERIGVQAKSWGLENSYKDPDRDVVKKSHVEDFAKKLIKEYRGYQGLFITTNFFTQHAKNFIMDLRGAKIELIDRIGLLHLIAQNCPEIIVGSYVEKTLGHFGNCPKCNNVLVYILVEDVKKRRCPDYPACGFIEDIL